MFSTALVEHDEEYKGFFCGLSSEHSSWGMRRHIANALREPNTKAKKETKKPTAEKRRLNPDDVKPEVCTMEFANAVRNTIGQKKEEVVKEVEEVEEKVEEPDCDDSEYKENMEMEEILKEFVVPSLDEKYENSFDFVDDVQEEDFDIVEKPSNTEEEEENNNNNNVTQKDESNTKVEDEKVQEAYKQKLCTVSRKYFGKPYTVDFVLENEFSAVTEPSEWAYGEMTENHLKSITKNSYFTGTFKDVKFGISIRQRRSQVIVDLKSMDTPVSRSLKVLDQLADHLKLTSYTAYDPLPEYSRFDVCMQPY